MVPLLVIVGWITHHDLTLFFADFEVRKLVGAPSRSQPALISVLVDYRALRICAASELPHPVSRPMWLTVVSVADDERRDGKSNYMEGLM